jgi:hypothetical protein
VLIVAASVIVVAAVVVLAFSIGRNVTTYESGTPESVAQEYLTAAFDGDFDRAAEFFEPSSNCDADDLDRTYMQENARISLADTVVEGERARVRVAVEIPSGGPLGGFYREEHTLRLVKIDNAWLLTGVPWPLYDCTLPGK